MWHGFEFSYAMCQGAIEWEWAGIATVCYGTSIPHLQQLGWQQIESRAEEVAWRSRVAPCLAVGGARVP
jgi:tRNA(adenine34) deaminase